MQSLTIDFNELKPLFPRDNFPPGQDWQITASAIIGQLQGALSNNGRRNDCVMLRPDTLEGVLRFEHRELMMRFATLPVSYQKLLPHAVTALMRQKEVGELLVRGVKWGRFTERTLEVRQFAGALDTITLSLK